MAQPKPLRSRRNPQARAYRLLRAALIEARHASGLTQAELAKALGRPQSFVAKYEGGERYVDAVELVALCTILEIDIDNLACATREALRLA